MPRVIVLDSFPLWRCKHLLVVRALKIPGMVWLSFGQNAHLREFASEGRLAERHTDGYFQCPVKRINKHHWEKDQAAP